MPQLDAVNDKQGMHTAGEKLKEGRRNDPEADVTVSVKLEDLMDNTGETLGACPSCLSAAPSTMLAHPSLDSGQTFS
jgi:hypothetical protein